MRRVLSVWIGDQKWKIVRTSKLGSNHEGECHYASKTLLVRSTLRGEDLLEVVIHELLHARFPDLCEETVLEFGQEMSAIIYALGFATEEEHDG